MTQLTTIDTNNFAAMAKAMGISAEADTKTSSSNLARMRINHTPLMGMTEVNGKNVNVEVVEGGTYRVDIPDGPTYYANSAIIRPYLQRFMYKRFVKGTNKTPNKFIKTIMHDDLNVDLKDNEGGFNCGKPAGYIKDFKALPEKMQELIKQIKRVRVIFGSVELVNPTNEKGEEVELDSIPFIWEIDNRDAFKTMGEPFAKFSQTKRLPVQHYITLTSEERKIPSGSSFYLPNYSLDLQKTIQVTDEDQNTFINFMAWIDNYNSYIFNEWEMKAKAPVSKEDKDIVDDFIDVEVEEEVA